ncbi:hypothetical protein [Pseudomarimonas salicorniae]|uniref:Uncharacterized protein n=1 Tax=Pseudomarimonas salicorniae TaxID=2933270 RepID=A0ABT0GCM1_9GAMM|nr:hypothetical protein [Lysobacter sp. CAU 1642]MCK7592283.1 hypothetical protein [Lysobacter sp. CAU 1642]
MSKLLLLVVVIAAAFSWNAFVNKQHAAAGNAAPEPVPNPVFAGVRVEKTVEDRSLEFVLLAETLDDQDCEMVRKSMPKDLKKACADCTLTLSECKPALEPRMAKLFKNQPTHLTYLSIGRGVEKEREMRMLAWGLSLEESHHICDVVPKFQQIVKGPVRCVRALN